VQTYLSGTGSPGSPEQRAVKRVCVCVCQLCSDSVDLNSDTITVDSVSLSSLPVNSLTRDSASFIAQMKPDVSTPSVISAEPQRGLSHSSDLLLVSSHAYKQDSLTNSVTTGTVPSIVIPSASAVDNSANRSSSQQRPKSLDQEFTLLNLDIPNVTIRGVSCFYVMLSFYCLQCFDAFGWMAGRASGLGSPRIGLLNGCLCCFNRC